MTRKFKSLSIKDSEVELITARSVSNEVWWIIPCSLSAIKILNAPIEECSFVKVL